MKRVKSVLTLASSLLLVGGMTANQALASFLPMIEYQFDDQTDFRNKVVRNHYFTNYTGTIAGNAVAATGVLGNSIQMNDSNVYVEIPNSQSLTFSRGLTVEASVWRSANTNEDAVISKWYGSDQFLLTFYNEGNGRLSFQVRFSDGTLGTVEYAIPSSSYLQKWTRVSATYNGAGQLQLYWNGQKVAERSFPKSGMASGNVPIRIGDANNTWSRFNGRIDEVRIWSRVLRSTEIGTTLRR